jgi:hypothetical protein
MPWNERYPIGRLVAARVGEPALSKNDVVRALGYRNLDRGRRRLDALLEGHIEAPDLANRVAAALHLTPEAIADALAATRKEIAESREAVARWVFRPKLLVDTNGDGPDSPLFIKAWAWPNQCVIDLPTDFTGWESSRQIRYVKRQVVRHYLDTGGRTSLFGRITGYRLQRTYDQWLRFTPAGRLRHDLAVPAPPAPPVLAVKGHPIPPALWTHAQG